MKSTDRLELHTLGGLRLTRGHAPVSGAGSRRKSLALLAFLASANSRGASRDKIAALLWPEADADAARTVLRQTLYSLRRDLGEPDLVLGSTELRLNTDVIDSDLARFDDAMRRNDPRAAVEVYKGPFLDAVYLREAPDFDQWVDDERVRRAHQFRSALEDLAKAATDRADWREAIQWWQRLTQESPTDSRIATQLMIAIASSGDRAAAVEYARKHTIRLEEELDVRPDPAFLAAAARIREGESETGGPPAALPPAGPNANSILRSHEPDTSVVRADRGVSAAQRRGRSLRWVAVAAILAVTSLVVWRTARQAARRADPRPTIVIAPFIVSSTDSSLRALANGVVDLLATRFAGIPSHAVLPSDHALTAFARISSSGSEAGRAHTVARKLGAQVVLTGAIVGSRDHIEITAVASKVGDTSPLAESRTGGSADSLFALLDHVAIDILSQLSGESTTRLTSLERATLPAVKAYLAGQVAYRRGDYEESAMRLREALLTDSMFALAGLRLALVSGWAGHPQAEHDFGLARAWAARDRLIDRDLAFLIAFGTGRIMALRSTVNEGRRRWQLALSNVPDWPEVWYEYGDGLFHSPSEQAEGVAQSDAASAMRRALALDSMFVPAIPHLLQVEARDGNIAVVKNLAARYLSRDSISGAATHVRWLLAHATGDTRQLNDMRSRMRSMPRTTLRWIIQSAIYHGFPSEDAVLASDAMVALGGSVEERRDTYLFAHDVALNQGRPLQALKTLEGLAGASVSAHEVERLQITDALYGGGDTTAARAASAVLEEEARQPTPDSIQARAAREEDLCVLGQWYVAERRFQEAERIARQLRATDDAAGATWEPARGEDILCSALLDVAITTAAAPARVRLRLATLDSLAQSHSGGNLLAYFSLLRARAFAVSGDTTAALRAVRSRWYFAFYAPYLATHLRQESEYALSTGDTVNAIAAMKHYLEMRKSHAAEFGVEVGRVRARLESLTRSVHASSRSTRAGRSVPRKER